MSAPMLPPPAKMSAGAATDFPFLLLCITGEKFPLLICRDDPA
jgi:hypothetical protein